MKDARLRAIDKLAGKMGCYDCGYLKYYHRDVADKAIKNSCRTHQFHKREKEKKEVKVTPKVEKEPEPCPIRRPEPRERGKMPQVLVSGRNPVMLEDAKWSTLKKWAEKTRDKFEKRGQFLTVGGLINLAYRQDLSYERRAKAAERLRSLYEPEWVEWRKGVERQIDDAIRREREAEEKKRQLLNQRPALPDRALVLRVIGDKPLTRKEVRKLSGVKKVLGILARLVRKGKVVKTVSGKYRLPRDKKVSKENRKKRAGK